MDYCERLERDARALRGELAGSFDELRRRLTPGRILDASIDYARDTPAAAFARNLARDLREHPLPLLLIGAGIAWAVIASLRPRDVAPSVGRDRIERVKTAAQSEEGGIGWLDPDRAERPPEWQVTAVTPATE